MLFLISIVLRFIVNPISFFYHLYVEIKALFTPANMKKIDNNFLLMAIQNDKYCCHADAELLNALFLTKDSKHLFGNIKETISSVLGKNYLAGTLTEQGYEICALLNGMENDHVLISIDNTI